MTDFTNEQLDALRSIADRHIAQQAAERELEAIVKRAVENGAGDGHVIELEPTTVWRLARELNLRVDHLGNGVAGHGVIHTPQGRMYLVEKSEAA